LGSFLAFLAFSGIFIYGFINNQYSFSFIGLFLYFFSVLLLFVSPILYIFNLSKIYKNFNRKVGFIIALAYISLFIMVLLVLIIIIIYFMWTKATFTLLAPFIYTFLVVYFIFLIKCFLAKKGLDEAIYIFKIDLFRLAGSWIFYGSFLIILSFIGYLISILAFAKILDRLE
jgi:uncharacterized membrane protein